MSEERTIGPFKGKGTVTTTKNGETTTREVDYETKGGTVKTTTKQKTSKTKLSKNIEGADTKRKTPQTYTGPEVEIKTTKTMAKKTGPPSLQYTTKNIAEKKPKNNQLNSK